MDDQVNNIIIIYIIKNKITNLQCNYNFIALSANILRLSLEERSSFSICEEPNWTDNHVRENDNRQDKAALTS